jgi:hypothetical protein
MWRLLRLGPVSGRDRAAKKHEIHEIDLKTVGIGGGTLPEPSSMAPSPPSTRSSLPP